MGEVVVVVTVVAVVVSLGITGVVVVMSFGTALDE